MPRNHLMPLMKCADNYGVRRESFILHESSGEGCGHREVIMSFARSVVTSKHMLQISNDVDGERCHELLFAASGRNHGDQVRREGLLAFSLRAEKTYVMFKLREISSIDSRSGWYRMRLNCIKRALNTG